MGGGAIYVSGPSTKVTIFDSILYNNRAYAGEAYASNQTNVVVKNTSLGGITTTNTGGALWCGYRTTCRIVRVVDSCTRTSGNRNKQLAE